MRRRRTSSRLTIPRRGRASVAAAAARAVPSANRLARLS